MLSWAKLPQAAFHDITGCFHLQDMLESSLEHFTWTSSLWNQHHFSTTGISDMGHCWVLHHSHHSACHSFLQPAVLSICCFAPPPLGKQRRQREGQLSAPDAASKPQTYLWKRLFAALGHLLAWGWGGSRCPGRVWLGQTPQGKHSSKVHPRTASTAAPGCARTSWGCATPLPQALKPLGP